jgi:Ca-activated chloride channel family protein
VDIQLQYKEFIWLFGAWPVIVLLFISILRWKKKVVKRIGDETLVKALIQGYSSKLFALKFIFLLLAIVLGVVAVMNLGEPGASDNISRKGIDVVVSLDVSKSMLATDVQTSRLEKAKEFILKLMAEMPDDRIGLVLFAGKAYMQMPLTVDHNAANLFVSSASPGAIQQQGTVISDALTMSSNVFNNQDRRFKTIVLISDGEGHDENAIETAKELSERGIMINTIGIGSPEGTFIIDPSTGENKKDGSGNVVITKLNEDLLKQIAQNTNGAYIHLQNSNEAVNEMTAQLSQIEKKALSDISLAGFHSYYLFFAAAMFILMLAEFFIPEKKKIVE